MKGGGDGGKGRGYDRENRQRWSSSVMKVQVFNILNYSVLND